MKTLKKHLTLLIAVLMVTAGTVSAQEETVINFDNATPGTFPEGWTNATGKWTVKQDGKNKVLAQTEKNSGGYFNIAVYDGVTLKDVEMSVDVRAISGREDQGGGLVWRYKDKNNYYIVRFNPLEDNYRFYKVENGRRIQLASAAHITLPEGKWFTVKVTVKGNKVTCYLNGKKYLEKTDDTFTKPGKVGFWTKADAVSDFDNLRFKGE
ncbi:MAG: DUF1080 domain-containing protein [Chlorobi bacterium]|nr:DUF1080 domain-containing protein [Chlorobiota bacterium]